jgi:hypothetical protein
VIDAPELVGLGCGLVHARSQTASRPAKMYHIHKMRGQSG